MEQPSPTHAATPDLEISHARLEKLVGELLAANQELRFRLAALEQDAARLERGLAKSCAASLWP